MLGVRKPLCRVNELEVGIKWSVLKTAAVENCSGLPWESLNLLLGTSLQHGLMGIDGFRDSDTAVLS